VEILNQLSETGHRKGPDFGPIGLSTITVLQLLRHSLSSSFWTKNLLLKYHGAPALKTFSVKQFLDQKFIIKIEHPSYSPDFGSK